MYSNVNPTDAGYVTGQLIVPLAFLAGGLKCWSISRRPGTNRKCALALMFVLLALALAGCLGILIRILGHSPGTIVVSGLIGLVMLGSLVTGFVLAILGLVEFSNRAGAFSQGRAQAIWALALASIAGLFVGASAVTSVLRQHGFTSAARKNSPGQTRTFDDLNFRFRTPERPRSEERRVGKECSARWAASP